MELPAFRETRDFHVYTMSSVPQHNCNLVYACPLKASLEIRKLILLDMKRTAKASARRINMLLPWSTPVLVFRL